MPPDEDKTLGEAGWREFRAIGQRYKIRYPGLLDVEYDEDDFEFLHSDHETNRTRDTARALAEGLWGTYGMLCRLRELICMFYVFCMHRTCIYLHRTFLKRMFYVLVYK